MQLTVGELARRCGLTIRAEWSAMVSTVQAAMDRGVSPDAPEAQILALKEWPPLLTALRKAMTHGLAPNEPEACALGKHWLTLFGAYAGDDPGTHERIREAHAKEPDLTDSSWADEALVGYVSSVIATLQTSPPHH
jgi:hypothetical protein